MAEILDLDVFAPPERSVRFTDRSGKELARIIAEDEAELARFKGPLARLRSASLRQKIARSRALLKGCVHTFDATFLSFRSSLFLLDHLDEFSALTKMKQDDIKEEQFRLILSIIAEIGEKSDPKITVDFLFDNLSITQGLVVLHLAMGLIMEFLQANPLQAPETAAPK